MMNNPQVIVALNNISKISDGKRILTNLDLETYDGEFLSLQGSSSDGKSTLLRPDVAEAIDYPSPVKDATPLLTPALRNNPMVFPSDKIKRLMEPTSAPPWVSRSASKGGKLYLQAPMTTEAASRKHQLNVPARTAPDSG
ncbi:hypothetical protein [Aeromonas sobria]|uniref:hypothetical protein n=1 Tax=Aeromonas sobria TaxID=646 RepID=UPI001EC9702E|nr:hypothetical protein [Aeromonas sobria]TNH87211.1 hypothetical protein CF140_03095 [Aeromonas sobria]